MTEVRIAVLGNVDSGKSTLVGVLTGGEMDNGRGSARTKVAVHQHEAESGRTSSASHHILGFDAKNQPVFQPIAHTASSSAKDKSWRKVIEASKTVINFVDLAGHERYLKTTIAGLTGCEPHYALLIVNSLAGITRMTKEHLVALLSLKIHLIVVVTKVDMCPENVFADTKKQLWRALKSSDVQKMPISVRDAKSAETCLEAPQDKIAPVFFVSAVTGQNLDMLTAYLGALKPESKQADCKQADCKQADCKQSDSKECDSKASSKETNFNIDHTYSVPGAGLVVSGILRSGSINVGSKLMLGPSADGYKQVVVKSIEMNRVPVQTCVVGSFACLAIRAVNAKQPLVRNHIRRGMVLVDDPKAYGSFAAQVVILHHSSTISQRYQAVVHCGNVRQAAIIKKLDGECLRNGDRALVVFEFLRRKEYIRIGQTILFREGSTKGVGTIVQVYD